MSISIPNKVLYIVRSGEGYSAVGHLPPASQRYVAKTARLLANSLDNDELTIRFDKGNSNREEIPIPKVVLCYGPGKKVRETAEIVIEELKTKPLHIRQLLCLDDQATCIIAQGIEDLGVIVGSEEQISKYLRTAEFSIPPAGAYVRIPLTQRPTRSLPTTEIHQKMIRRISSIDNTVSR